VIERVDGPAFDAVVPELAELLVDAVRSGATVGFLAEVTPDEAAAWWRSAVVSDVESGAVRFYAARDGAGVCGCVLVRREQKPNGAHRADVAKLLVHTRARSHGLGRALLSAAVEGATADGMSLLLLDVRPDTVAEQVARGEPRAGT